MANRKVKMKWRRNPDFPDRKDEYLITVIPAYTRSAVERRATYEETLFIMRLEDFSTQRRILESK